MSDNPRTMQAPPPNDSAPVDGDLVRELRSVVNRGAWARALDPDELPCLLALACVAGPAQENGITAQAQLIIVLKQVVEPKGRPDDGTPEHPNAKRALALLLGTADTTMGFDSTTRRKRTRDYLHFGMDLSTFNRRHVQPLLELLADQLI